MMVWVFKIPNSNASKEQEIYKFPFHTISLEKKTKKNTPLNSKLKTAEDSDA